MFQNINGLNILNLAAYIAFYDLDSHHQKKNELYSMLKGVGMTGRHPEFGVLMFYREEEIDNILEKEIMDIKHFLINLREILFHNILSLREKKKSWVNQSERYDQVATLTCI